MNILEPIKSLLTELAQPVEIPFPFSFILRLILLVFYIAVIICMIGAVIAIPAFWILSLLGLV